MFLVGTIADQQNPYLSHTSLSFDDLIFLLELAVWQSGESLEHTGRQEKRK
jgi:hypothetical protein